LKGNKLPSLGLNIFNISKTSLQNSGDGKRVKSFKAPLFKPLLHYFFVIIDSDLGRHGLGKQSF
tara:strand:+ start:23 stop:214 length:192 start_codon:yes stop_codon:yes gene_type:complete